jgi:hypothetical protein
MLRGQGRHSVLEIFDGASKQGVGKMEMAMLGDDLPYAGMEGK